MKICLNLISHYSRNINLPFFIQKILAHKTSCIPFHLIAVEKLSPEMDSSSSPSFGSISHFIFSMKIAPLRALWKSASQTVTWPFKLKKYKKSYSIDYIDFKNNSNLFQMKNCAFKSICLIIKIILISPLPHVHFWLAERTFEKTFYFLHRIILTLSNEPYDSPTIHSPL